MNRATLERLEFDRVLGRLEGFCGSPGGRALVGEMDIETDAATVRALLTETTEARRFLDRTPPDWSFSSLPDMDELLARISAGAILEPQELHAVRLLLDFSENLHAGKPDSERCPVISGIIDSLFTAPDIAKRISRAVDETGNVLDSASGELARARRRIRKLEADIPGLLRQFVNDPQNVELVQERIVTVRNGRFVVPVRAGRAGGDRYVLQDRSSSGATFFVEPLQAVTHNNELAQERLAERNEVLRVLRELTALVEGCAEPLSELGCAVARLDLLLAKGRLSIAMRGSEPVITDKDAIVISAGRHPLIAEDPVPIDITLGGVVRALILTGPNAGGKTVALKMVGLFQLMAQAGLHVPALDGTRLPVFGDIFAVIGDEQSIERGLSTFTSHLTDIAEITASAKRGALVLIDEICSGSDPQEGTALACSILKSLMDAGAACMATSHHGGLKTFASVTPGAKNARVLFDEDRGAPRFIVEIGLAGKSHALEVAARAGLPRPIVEGARGYLDAQSQMAERMLAELEQMKGVLAVEKAAIDRERENVAVERKIVEEKISAAEKQRRETLAKAVAQADKLVEETRDKCRRLLDRADAATALPEKAAVKGEIERTRREVKEVVQKVRPRHGRAVSQQDLKPGATLTLRDTGQQAQFLSGPDRKGRVKVLIGEITMTTDTKNLGVPDGSEPPQPKKYRSMSQHEYYIEAAKDRARDNIDVRGMRAAEAIETLEPEIATLHLAGRRQFTIVTGVGTGALMRAVHEYLTGNPFVARFEPAPLSQGGIGATIVFLSE